MAESEYQKFLDERLGAGRNGVVDVYHAVRRIRYGSTGDRDPMDVIANDFGSCSGKHLLLRDLMRRTGREAEVITMFTYFNRGIPSHPDMPETLRAMIDGEDICDFHQYVRVRSDEGWQKLDATWHDALIPYGFPVNHEWDGVGDTMLAGTPEREYPSVEELVEWKINLIMQLTPRQRETRSEFFRELTEWMEGLGEARVQ